MRRRFGMATTRGRPRTSRFQAEPSEGDEAGSTCILTSNQIQRTDDSVRPDRAL